MSYIFEALQRAEAERSVAGSTQSATVAFELLERAERARFEAPERDLASGGRLFVKQEPAVAPLLPHPDAGREKSIAGQRALRTARAAALPKLLESCEVLRVDSKPQGRLVSAGDGGTPAAEAFRLLSVRLRQLRRERPLQKVLVTSTIPQEGKSLVAANLACAMASGARESVVLLEGDVRRPSLARIFGLSSHPGLCEWLDGKRTLSASVYRLEGAGVWLMPSGSPPSNPLGILESAPLPHLLDQLSEFFDWVIIDSPPILPIADTSVWSRLVDGILLVTRQGVTEKGHLERGLAALDTNKLIGALLNSSRHRSDDGYYANSQVKPS
jgi:capsular exopolysaccharide synthesis family protein